MQLSGLRRSALPLHGLSILYLRCHNLVKMWAGGCLKMSFNSLFEMPIMGMVSVVIGTVLFFQFSI